MPAGRPKDAKSHLSNFILVSGGEKIKFPTAFVTRMEKSNLTKRQQRDVMASWLDEMASNGYSAARIYNERTVIASNVNAISTFAASIAKVTGVATDVEDDDETVVDFSDDDENDASLPVTVAALPRGAAQTRVLTQDERDLEAKLAFRTDEDYFFGIARHNPPMFGTPEMREVYVNGGADRQLAKVCQVIAWGGYPSMLTGEAGSGKSMLPKYIASQVGLAYFQIGCDAFTEYDDFVGKYVPGGSETPENQGVGKTAAGVYYWADGPLTLAAELGGLVVVEEYDMVKQAVLAALREVLTGGNLVIRSAAGYRTIKLHKNFRLVATRNGKNYSGTNELSLAEFDRFITFKFDYPDAEKELRIVAAHVSLDVTLEETEAEAPMEFLPRRSFPKLYAEKVIAFAGETRTKLKNDPESIRYVCSTRTVVKIARIYSELGWSLRDAVETSVLNVAAEIDPEEFKYVEGLVNARFPHDDAELDDTTEDPLASVGIGI